MKAVFLLLLLIALSSCGGGGGAGSVGSGFDLNGPSQAPIQLLSQSIEQYSVDCADEKDCPDYVARLVLSDNYRSWSCTGFLIDPQTIATAGHCLPANISQPGQSCAGQIYALFPEQTSLTKTPLECDQVLEVQRGGEGDYDYAFLKLKESYPAPFVAKINRDHRLDGQKTVLYKVDPNLFDEKKSTLTKTTCELKDSSLLSLTFSSARSSQIQYSGCLTVQGNSGSPVMNSRGEVVGIHNASTKATSAISLMLSQYAKPSNQMTEFSSATNFGCLCPKGQSYQRCVLDTSCRSQNNQEFLLTNRQLIIDRIWDRNQRSMAKLEVMTKSFDQLSDDLFEWQSTLHFQHKDESFKLFLTQRPVCLKKQYKFSDIPFQGNKLIKKDIPFCELEMTLNKHYEITQLGYKPESCKLYETHFELNHPVDLELKTKIRSSQGAPEFFSPGRKIPYCL